jgi:hypothetical protein
MRTSQKIHEDKTIKYMGGNMPRIYATLDNKQAEYQSPMIEVEGKIDNQPIELILELAIVTLAITLLKYFTCKGVSIINSG